VAVRVDGALAVPEVGEHARQQLVRLGASRVGVDELAHEALGAPRLVAVDQHLGEHGQRFDVAGMQLEHALQHADTGLPVALPLELRSRLAVLGERLVGEALLLQQLGDLEPARGVRGVEARHAAQQVERLALAPVAVVGVRSGLQRRHRFRHQTESLVEIG